ncbi:MAG TPA: hypothetical protein [Caudoviricetes sp.]|nr:MAG TPA: hypothetical protein [Caudoviricetes sp.]
MSGCTLLIRLLSGAQNVSPVSSIRETSASIMMS